MHSAIPPDNFEMLSRLNKLDLCGLFKASAQRSVCLSVCLCVRLFTFEVPFTHLFAPTSQSRISNTFRDSESLGKSNGKIWTFFVWKWSIIAKQKKSFFLADFSLQNKVETTLPNGLETSGRRAYREFCHISRCFWVFAFAWFFPFFKQFGFWGYSWSTQKPCSQWIRDLWSKGTLP